MLATHPCRAAIALFQHLLLVLLPIFTSSNGRQESAAAVYTNTPKHVRPEIKKPLEQCCSGVTLGEREV